MMDDFNTETDSDYTSYWRDWVSECPVIFFRFLAVSSVQGRLGEERGGRSGGDRFQLGRLELRQS